MGWWALAKACPTLAKRVRGFETPATGVTPGTTVSCTDYRLAGDSDAADWLVLSEHVPEQHLD